MKVIKVTKEYFETEDEKVYFFEPLEKEISVEDMQKIVDANEELVKAFKNNEHSKFQWWKRLHSNVVDDAGKRNPS